MLASLVRVEILSLVAVTSVLAAGCDPAVGQGKGPESLWVFSAMSLRDAMQAVAPVFESSHPTRLRFNFAGSNVLALQIEASRKGDLFLSANEEWIRYLERAGAVDPQSTRVFLSNTLVIIANVDSTYALARPEDLAKLPFRYLSVGDPNAVPAGRYAKGYLASLTVGDESVWDGLATRVAPAPDVRAALAMVEAREDVVGMVYRTDVEMSDRVRIMYKVPIGLVPPVRYFATLVRGRPQGPRAKEFLTFLSSPAARAVFERRGFITEVDR